MIINSIAILTLTYAFFTLISSGLLYASFRKKMDESAIYFLISELCMTTTCIILFLTNINVIQINSLWLGIPNFAALCAELAILFSILSLTKKVEKKWVFVGLVSLALIVIAVELLRGHVSDYIIVLLISICTTALFTMTYLACRYQLSNVLANNQFMGMLTWFEFGMVVYGVARILGYFASQPVIPRDNPGSLSLVIFSFFVVMGTFRYLSYIGLRVTWVNPNNPTQNLLNKPLLTIIQEKDRLLGKLMTSNRMIGISALASSLVHQLAQPLTTISLQADTTRRTLAKEGRNTYLIASLDEIANQSSKLAEFINRLRQLFGGKSISCAPVHLQEMIEEIIEVMSPDLQSKGITLQKFYRDDPIVNADSVQIQQVLINIFNNAIDSLVTTQSDGKTISVSLTYDDHNATIVIEDNGHGIHPNSLATIFDLYKTTKKEGLGVGLWLSKTIIEAHHGSITAANRSDGGALFTIQLPIHRDAKNNE